MRSSGERDGGLGVDVDGRASTARLLWWRWINRSIRAFSRPDEEDDDEGDDGWFRERMRRAKSAFTTSDMVGDGVESREETRIGEDGRDIAEQRWLGQGSGEVFDLFGGTRRRWEF